MGPWGILCPGPPRCGKGQANAKHRRAGSQPCKTKGRCAASLGARSLACLCFQRGHPFAEQPKGLVELDILIDAVHGAGLHTTRPAEIIAANTSQPAFDAVRNRPQCRCAAPNWTSDRYRNRGRRPEAGSVPAA